LLLLIRSTASAIARFLACPSTLRDAWDGKDITIDPVRWRPIKR
jgi:hypothetical protein